MKNKSKEVIYDYFREFLSTQKLRLTSQRELILDQFIKSEEHLDVETIFENTKKIDGNIGLATIYRTVKLLSDAGIVREVRFADDRTYYEAIMERAHHDHLLCEICGKNIEFYETELEELQEKIAEKYKFKLTNHFMNLYGICEKCRSLGMDK